MEDRQNAGKPVWVTVLSLVVMRLDHDICAGSGVEGILSSSHIVGRIVNAKDFVTEEDLILNDNL